jgi:hypothetical protein
MAYWLLTITWKSMLIKPHKPVLLSFKHITTLTSLQVTQMSGDGD